MLAGGLLVYAVWMIGSGMRDQARESTVARDRRGVGDAGHAGGEGGRGEDDDDVGP